MAALKRTRSKIAFLCGLTALAAAVLLFYARAIPDPMYRGKPLSDYLYAAYWPFTPPGWSRPIPFSASSRAARESAHAALKALGPDAVPLLVSWLGEVDTPMKRAVRLFCLKHNLPRPGFLEERSQMAAWAFTDIAEHGQAAVPILERWLKDGVEARAELGAALLDQILRTPPQDKERIAARALPLALSLLERATNAMTRHAALGLLDHALQLAPPRLESENEELVRKVIGLRSSWQGHAGGAERGIAGVAFRLDADGIWRNRMLLQSGSAPEKAAAAIFFRDKPVLPDRIIPLLIPCLASTNHNLQEEGAKALGAYGPQAIAALPILKNMLAHSPKKYVALAVSNAIPLIDASGFSSGNSFREVGIEARTVGDR